MILDILKPGMTNDSVYVAGSHLITLHRAIHHGHLLPIHHRRDLQQALRLNRAFLLSLQASGIKKNQLEDFSLLTSST